MAMLDSSVPDRACMSYLEQLMKIDKMGIEGVNFERKDLKEIIAKVKEAYKVALMVSLAVNSSDKTLDKRVLSQYLTKKAQELEVGQELMIPSGYIQGDTSDVLKEGNGHSIFVKCTKIYGDEFRFGIFNTGEGTEVHQFYDGKVFPKKYEGILEQEQLAHFFKNLTECYDVSLEEKKPVTLFYDCFAGLTEIKWDENNEYHKLLASATQNIGSCTQYSLRAFINTELRKKDETVALYGKIDDFIIEDGIKKCEEFIETLRTEHHNYELYYQHPGLKPMDRLHFLLIWILSCIFIDRELSYKGKQLELKVEQEELETFLSVIKTNPPEKEKVAPVQTSTLQRMVDSVKQMVDSVIGEGQSISETHRLEVLEKFTSSPTVKT
jgi:hypothetical protein